MKVLKFGGTSVGSTNNINTIISILKEASKADQLAVVVSAVGGVTDMLLEAAHLAVKKDTNYTTVLNTIKEKHYTIVNALIDHKNIDHITAFLNTRFSELQELLNGIFLINELSPKTTDKLLSFGESISSVIVHKALEGYQSDVVLKNAQELIVTDHNYTNASVHFEETNRNIKSYFLNNTASITILPGFISKSSEGELTTLGRGGSDYTAAIIANAIEADVLEIWTDVSGMFTANPRLVKQAKPIPVISYQEAIELSHFGAKVLYPPTVMPVLNKSIPIVIKNTFNPNAKGTLITDDIREEYRKPVKGISNINDIALLTLQGNGMVGIPGFSKRLFETLAQEKINIVLITQASSEHSICLAVSQNDAEKAKIAVDQTFENEIALEKVDPLIVENNLSIIAVIGDQMKSHQGISGKMFSALGKNNVNIRAIAQGASERNISAVINTTDVKKALNTLHERFFEIKTKQVNVFITGVGNVGERLINQIQQQNSYLKKQLKVNMRVIGLSNSRTMAFNEDGIDLKDWKVILANGKKADIQSFYNTAKAINLRNSVFVDITASKEVSEMYTTYLKASIAVVACNKIACSGSYEYYKSLKLLSKAYNAPFLFETNVGAGLPVIDTLNHLINSGDKVKSIKAVLSGSLNFIFNNYDGQIRFHDVVKRAQEEGYTEPDPRIDLSGIDVARKILILARESNNTIDLEDIQSEHFLTHNALEAKTVDAFYDTLIEEESHYKDLYDKASQNNCKLKYVAEFINGKAKVGLEEIPNDHPFYNLEGKDNIVMFYTERYSEQPMIIKGAGAGADVTASGIFADIIRLSNN